MNRVDRLMAILLLMQRERKLRAQDLAAHFGLSERSIYRDMQALQAMGIPIQAQAGEGYLLLDSFRLPPIALQEAEALAAFLAMRMFIQNATGDIAHHAQAALHKIEAVLTPAARQHARTLASLIAFYPADKPLRWDDATLMLMVQAIAEKRVVRLRYRRYHEQVAQEREVEADGLSYSQGAWYVNGFCRLRQDRRSFRVSRILHANLLDETFIPRQVFPAKTTPIKVQVRFAPAIRADVDERQHYAYRSTDPAGCAHYEVHDLREIRGWLLGFGAQAEVLAPPELRAWLREEAQRLIQLLT